MDTKSSTTTIGKTVEVLEKAFWVECLGPPLPTIDDGLERFIDKSASSWGDHLFTRGDWPRIYERRPCGYHSVGVPPFLLLS
jgi:hypothetical protein